MTRWYRMNDAEPRGVFELEPREASAWNRKGHGIFWSVNSFNGPRRIENLTRIDAWAVDIDEGTKAQMEAKISASPLRPSLVVETKRGYQSYWRAKDGRAEHWNALVLDRLVPHFGADKNARDLARILRVPGYLHQKDPANPFLVKTAYAHEVSYTERQVADAFPDLGKATRDEATRRQMQRQTKQEPQGDEFWERAFSLDCEYALERLSGSGAVGGERYSFRPTSRGAKNLLVDGKGTSCWIDENKRIGSLAHGGPSVIQWLRYFNHSYRDIAEILKREFPELERR